MQINKSSTSTLMRSLSKCFDPPLDDAIVEETGGGFARAAVASKAGNGEFLSILIGRHDIFIHRQ